MSTVGAVLVIAAGLALLAVVVNQIQARIGLLEVTLTEGLPPGHQSTDATSSAASTKTLHAPEDVLSPGVHVFVSRSCHACQRLVEEMEHAWRPLDAATSLRYVDRPRPFARTLADQLNMTSVEHDAEIAAGIGADPLPYTVAIGEHGLVARGVTPTVHLVQDIARDAGMRVDGVSA